MTPQGVTVASGHGGSRRAAGYLATVVLGLSGCSVASDPGAVNTPNAGSRHDTAIAPSHSPGSTGGVSSPATNQTPDAAVVVPDVFLEQPREARRILNEAGFKGRVVLLGRGLPPYQVFGQSPKAGSTAAPGDVVRIYPS